MDYFMHAFKMMSCYTNKNILFKCFGTIINVNWFQKNYHIYFIIYTYVLNVYWMNLIEL
jgi:hypothetical protein